MAASTSKSTNNKTTLRDAALKDIALIESRVKFTTTRFFGTEDVEARYRASCYSLIMEYEDGKLCAYANFTNSPNISVIDVCWLDWLQANYMLPKVHYGNTLFLTYLVFEDPYDTHFLKDFLTEIYLREPKINFICTVCPPIDSIYEEILEVYCKQIYALEESVNRLCQSLFVSERYEIIPKMRLRRALSEDNDDLVEIIDEKLPAVRLELGDFYIAEQVMRNDPTETIVVAEISNATIGMIWINANVHRKALADNFEISAYGNFVKPQTEPEQIETRVLTDIIPKRPDTFFNKGRPGTMEELIQETEDEYDDNRMSLNNLYFSSSETSGTTVEDEEDRPDKNMFQKWDRIAKNLKGNHNYRREVRKIIKMPKTTDVTNAFAIQLFGLSKTIDPRRIFDLLAAAFASYPSKDYCLLSLSSSEASSDALCGPILRYFSRVVPRPGCKISDCLYVTHRNSFLADIVVDYLTYDDITEIQSLLCLTEFHVSSKPYSIDIIRLIMEYLEDPWSMYQIFVMRCAGVVIGFVILHQNLNVLQLRLNYVVYDDATAFPDWKSSELKYLHLHPVFVWEWAHVVREIFRYTGFVSMYFKLRREKNKPILNSILLNMLPLFARKKPYNLDMDIYALYYLNFKLTHMKRNQIENKIVIVGFNEVCKGFLRTLIFSHKSQYVQCLNITVITDCPGFIEAEHDIRSFKNQDSSFFRSKNQFDAIYLRRLEFRTWVRFIGARLKRINGEKKHIILDNGSIVRYDRLYLMCSSRYSAPKALKVAPANYFEINSRLDKIIFFNRIQVLVTEHENETTLPIIVYGTVVIAHSCVSTLLDLGVKPELIYFIIPRTTKVIDFPETFEDEYMQKYVFEAERNAGIKIFERLKFIDLVYGHSDNVIESVIFESDYERIVIPCTAFISYHGEAFSSKLRATLTSSNIISTNKIIIDEYCKTNVPFVYALGRITQYKEQLFAAQIEQKYFNQIEIGNQLAVNFIHERRTGIESSMLDATFVKPLFREIMLIDGLLYAGLRKPGRYVPRGIRKNLQGYGHDLVTCDNNGEYCRVAIDKNGILLEITCLTRKYTNLEFLYRIYGLHESMLDNMSYRYHEGEIENLLDFICREPFTVLLHDLFFNFKELMRKKNLECLKEYFQKGNKIDRKDIQEFLKNKGMHEVIQKDLITFIAKHWKTIHPHYALPSDFAELLN